jgi:hypothetical protein
VAVAALLLSLAATDEAQARGRRGGSCGSWGGSSGSAGCWGGSNGSHGSFGGRWHRSSGSCGSSGGYRSNCGGCESSGDNCNTCQNCGDTDEAPEAPAEPHTANYQPSEGSAGDRNTQRGHAEPNAPALNTEDRSNTTREYQAPRDNSAPAAINSPQTESPNQAGQYKEQNSD